MTSEIIHEPVQIQYPLWSITQISLASYFGGPVAGCYFLGKNFQQLGSPNYAKRCYFAGIAATIVLITIPLLLPEEVMQHLPRLCIPIITSSLVVTYASYYQKKLIKEKLKVGAKRCSYWWCLLMIISFIIIQIPLFFLYGFLIGVIF